MKNVRKAIGLEEKRIELARLRKYTELKKFYKHNLAEIKNLNMPVFWDKLLSQDKERGFAMYQDKIEVVKQMLSNERGNLLDIGFGNGELLIQLARNKNLNLYGIEISEYALSKIKGAADGEFKKGYVTEIPFPKKYFSAVVALDVLEHILPSKIFKALGEIKRVMKKDGKLLISVPLNEGLPEMLTRGDNPNGHVRIYTSELIKAELKIAGFKVVREDYLCAFRNFYKLKNIMRKMIFKNRWQPNLAILEAKLL